MLSVHILKLLITYSFSVLWLELLGALLLLAWVLGRFLMGFQLILGGFKYICLEAGADPVGGPDMPDIPKILGHA